MCMCIYVCDTDQCLCVCVCMCVYVSDTDQCPVELAPHGESFLQLFINASTLMLAYVVDMLGLFMMFFNNI